jgi:hypothetical protein
MSIGMIYSLLTVFASVVSAEPTNTTLQGVKSASMDVPLLTPDHVYYLLVFSIVGSLGVLGLLLGLDKVIIMLVRRREGTDAYRKYSSESVARILPIVIEGITVILVILTIIILGASRIVSAEGALGILGSIVGYVLGKSTRKGSPRTNGPTA